MATGRLPDPNSSPLTAKGDLYTYSTVPAKLAVGNSGETLVADSSTATGLRYQGNFAAGKNKIINGDFGIWQRGTSFSPPALDSLVADRFRTYFEGSGTTRAVTRQTFTPGTAPVAGYEGQYFLRYAQTVGPSAGIGNNLLMQNIEDVRTFAGQTVTFSFWAKTAATTVLPEVYAYQYFGTGGSPSGNVYVAFATNVSVGTSWTRYSYTATIPSISGKTIGTNNDGYISFRTQHPLGSGNTFTIDYWGWQVEAGSVATAFQTATGTLAGELQAAQRYYQKSYSITTNPGTVADAGRQNFSSGANNSNWNAFTTNLRVSMRTPPTVTLYDIAGTAGKITTLAQNSTETNGVTGGASYISNQSFGLFLALSSQAGIAYHYVAEAEI